MYTQEHPTKPGRYVTMHYCPYCETDVSIRLEDCGIGDYEYWGVRGFDKQEAYFCNECDEQIEDIED